MISHRFWLYIFLVIHSVALVVIPVNQGQYLRYLSVIAMIDKMLAEARPHHKRRPLYDGMSLYATRRRIPS